MQHRRMAALPRAHVAGQVGVAPRKLVLCCVAAPVARSSSNTSTSSNQHGASLLSTGPTTGGGVGLRTAAKASATMAMLELQGTCGTQLQQRHASAAAPAAVPPHPQQLPAARLLKSRVSPPHIVDLTVDNFEAVKNAAEFVLIDYYTDWCGPCKLMHKEMDRLSQAFPTGVVYAKLNVGKEENASLSATQRIRSLPTFRLFKGGKLLEQVTGAKPIELRQLLGYYVR